MGNPELWTYLLGATAHSSLLLATHRGSLLWAIGLVAQLTWLAYVLTSGQYEFVLLSGLCLPFYLQARKSTRKSSPRTRTHVPADIRD